MKNKSKIFIILSLFTIGLFITLVNVNAEENISTLALNKKQTEIANKIQEEINTQDYPSYYGGLYISDDSSHVILQVVEGNMPKVRSSKEYSSFNKISKIDNKIEIEYVKNSYKELNEINDKLIEYFSSDNADLTNLVAHYVDTFSNKVVIELINTDVKEVEKLKSTALKEITKLKTNQNSDLITFIQGKQNEETSLKAGEKISVNGGYCSMGYRVKVNDKKGYITTGHCFEKVGDSATGGTVKWLKYDGKVDAAFVQSGSLNLFTDPLNDLMYTGDNITKLNATLSAMPAINTNIAKAGYSTGYQKGQIKNLNYSATFKKPDGSTKYFTGLVATSAKTEAGDSGGPVFIPTHVDGNDGATLLGKIGRAHV